MDIKKVIKDYIIKNDYSLKGVENIIDCEWLASDTSYKSALIRTNYGKLDIYIIKPWSMCPAGKIEINAYF